MTELSARTLLIPYLFTRPERGVVRWYGVSAYSLDDARALLLQYGYDIDPSDSSVTIREHVVLTEQEQPHIGPNMGPMQLRGVWFPQHNLGDAAGWSGGDRDQSPNVG
jgi:hypothetical protein